MPDGAGVGSVVAPIAGGAAGYAMSQADRDRAAKLRQDAIDAYTSIHVPTPDEQRIQLQRESSVGEYNPQLEALYQQGPSAANDISTDPRLKQAQLQALSSLQGISDSGGMTLQDQANEAKLIATANQNEAANRGAIQQSMATRGMSGSGFELAAQLANQQGAATRAATNQTDIAAQAQQRALAAIQAQGTLGSNIQAQDFNQQAQVANANDIISKFNTSNSQAVAGTNTATQNDAQKANLNNNQAIANTNTGFANQQEQFNKNLTQTQFNNQITRANGVSSATSGAAAGNDASANRTQQTWAGVGQGVGEAFAANGQKKSKADDNEE